jgi:CMP-N,N'-diacetyllegionaminic acid synthase
MIDGGQVLAVIPARGGSKGVPRKNVRRAGGKPLIGWTIDAARGSRHVDRVILSSDDAEIAAEARRLGCDVPFMREARLAQDGTPAIDVVLDALERLPGYAWVLLLQPTSPLRTAADIDGAVETCRQRGAPSCVSVTAAQESPYWMYTRGADGRLVPLLQAAMPLRRQDLPPVYSLNGAIYLARTDWLAREKKFISPETVAYEMPAERSLDIDTESDFLQLQFLLGDLKDASRNVPLSPPA